LSQDHRTATVQVWALVAVGGQCDSHSSDVSQQDELRGSQQPPALEILQTEITFHPGKVAFNGGARRGDKALPLLQKEQSCQFALVSPAQVVLNRCVGMQNGVDDFEPLSRKIGCIGIHDPNAKSVPKGGKQQDKPPYLAIMNLSGCNPHKDRQIALMAQDRVHFVAKQGFLTAIFLPGGIRIVPVPGFQQGRIDNQFLAAHHA